MISMVSRLESAVVSVGVARTLSARRRSGSEAEARFADPDAVSTRHEDDSRRGKEIFDSMAPSRQAGSADSINCEE